MVCLRCHDGLLIDYATLTHVGDVRAVAAAERSPSKDRASAGYRIIVAMPASTIDAPWPPGMTPRLTAIPVIATTRESSLAECSAQGCALAKRQVDALQQQRSQRQLIDSVMGKGGGLFGLEF
jgi:hypothetical protein